MINDAVNNPKHYDGGMTDIKCIMFVRVLKFDTGNAFKYIWRAGAKDDKIQDMDKALYYLNDAIEYGIKEDMKHLIPFLPKSALDGWKYNALCAILLGDNETARFIVESKLYLCVDEC